MDFDLLDDIDVSSDQGEIEMIRGDVAALNRHYDEIAAQGGICRNTAQVLVRDCAVQLPENAPINSFTEAPSRTNLTITQEGIVSTIATHVVDIVKKAAALLSKIARWIMDQLRKLMGSKNDTVKQVKAIGAINAVAHKHSELKGTDAPANASGHLQAEFERAVQAADQAHASYESNFNELVHDMLTQQKFTKLLRNVGIDLLAQHSDIETKLSMYVDLLRGKLNGGNTVDTAQLTHQLKQIIEPIALPRIQQQLSAAGVSCQTAHLSDICSAVRTHCSQLRNTRPSSVMGYEEAANVMSTHAEEFVTPYVTHPEEWMRTMDSLDRQLHQLQTIPASAPISQDVAKLYIAASDAISKEITALRQFYVTTVACDTVRNQFCDDLWEMFLTITKMMKVKSAMLGNDASGLRDDLNAIGAQLRVA